MNSKKGQVAIFVIIAIVIVASIVIIVLFFPNVADVFVGEFTPQSFLKSCVEEDLMENVGLLASQGGYKNPEGFIVHEGKKIKYLCYTSEYYKTCSVQQPMIKGHFEGELESLILPKANECARALKAEYEDRGFGVSSGEVKSDVEIVPGKIKIGFEAPMTITKDTTQTFRDFDVEIDSEIYDLLLTAQSIIDFESEFGDSETGLYLQYYPDLKIEKMKLSEGTTIYKISDVVSGDEFMFASRSLAWPPGYGLEA
tara:strand:+ start:235 stop:999 length:765 start_codon:yes stop_codon:yes gene_type:complete